MKSNKSLPWIGEFPENWDLMPNKALIRKKKVLVGQKTDDYPLLSLTKRGVIIRNIEEGGKFPENFDSYQRVSSGDLVTCLFDVPETPRTIGLSRYDGMITGAYDIFEFTDRVIPRYFEYYYLALDNRKALSYFYSGLRNVIRTPVFLSISMPVPPLNEQKAIADFLDRELAQIDILIQKQEVLINLLELRKRAFISLILTSGLRRSRDLKPSGAPWGGLIPVDWKCVPLWTVSTQVKRSNAGMIEDNLLSLSYGNIVRRSLDGVDGLLPESFETYQIVLPDDLVFRLTDLQNDTKSLRSGLVREKGIITSAYLAIKLHENVDAVYFDLMMRSLDLAKVFYGMGSGLRQSLKWQEFRRLLVYLPPILEQREIALEVTRRARQYEEAIRGGQRLMESLNERRQSLISAAVTGKIDLRKVA